MLGLRVACARPIRRGISPDLPSQCGPLPSSVGEGGATTTFSPIFGPQHRPPNGHPGRSGILKSTELQSPSPISRHLANDDANELYDSYVCSKSRFVTKPSVLPSRDSRPGCFAVYINTPANRRRTGILSEAVPG